MWRFWSRSHRAGGSRFVGSWYCEPRGWARAYEQLRRFEERAATPHKQHKITNDDWRNRARWDDYYQAVSEMFERTSSVRLASCASPRCELA